MSGDAYLGQLEAGACALVLVTPTIALVREIRGAEGEYDRLPAILKDVLERRPDGIVAVAPQPARAAKLATSTVPIVMRFVADPVLIGLVVRG